jgi:membrane protein YdbS with pleckstrin-like domain
MKEDININTKNQQELLTIKPNFNFIYELFMPTGKKITSTFSMAVIFLITTILVSNYGGSVEITNFNITNDFKILDALSMFCYIILGLSILKLIFHIVFQKLQYNHITYTFYKDHMTYIDDFLNQHRKNIQYKNVKEVEIRRTIWDRILRYGIIVIYTNAENDNSNGLVVYGIKNPDLYYEKIDKIVHSGNFDSENAETKEIENKLENKTINTDIDKEEKNSEEEFKKSLQNINKD